MRRESTMSYPRDTPGFDLEAPEADAAEQATDADPTDEPEDEPTSLEVIEVPEWDALEQSREVPLDDDYE
jgi:hypothetical protein